MLGSRGLIALLATLGLCLPAMSKDTTPVLVGTVTKVIDGDTIDVKLSSGPIRVRLHAIDTPERGQTWFNESTQALSDLVMGKEVSLVPFEQDGYDYRCVARAANDRNYRSIWYKVDAHCW